MTIRTATLTLGAILFAGTVFAAQPPQNALSVGVYAYPPEDKSEEQVREDDMHCYQWSVNYTGQDPLKIAETQLAAQPEEASGGKALGGAAAGATAGVLIGDNRESAAKGAATGAVIGGIANNRQRRANSQQREDAQVQADESMDQFKMGYSSCLTSRGYSVRY